MSSLLDIEVFVSVFVTLLVIMDPPGALPIFLALTGALNDLLLFVLVRDPRKRFVRRNSTAQDRIGRFVQQRSSS